MKSADELAEIIRDRRNTLSERAAAIDQLHDRGKSYEKIAEMAAVSKALISEIDTCWRNLIPAALEWADQGRMRLDAAYLLATKRDISQQEVLRVAKELVQKRDNAPSARATGKRGRRTPVGVITKIEIEKAVDIVRSRHGL